MENVKREMAEVKQLTTKDLALYLGCTIIVFPRHRTPRRKNLDKSFLDSVHKIKPILRPTSDMTDEELEIYTELAYIEYANGLRVEADSPQSFKFLLENYFDLFGWISAGLAIDATTLSPNPYN